MSKICILKKDEPFRALETSCAGYGADVKNATLIDV